MGTSLVTAFRAFGAVHHLAGALGRRFRRRPAADDRAAALPDSAHRPVAIVAALAVDARAKPARHIRVVRILESSQAAASAGRMVISGRMADVCAELDRMAALEAAAG